MGVSKAGASPASRDRGSKIKIRGAKIFAEFFWPKSHVISKKKKGLRRNPMAFSDRNCKFSDQKQVISKKKRSSPKSEGFFWPKLQNLTFFPPNNTNFFLPKKFRGGARKNRGGGGQKRKSEGHCPPDGDAPDLKSGHSCYVRLALTPSFLTQPFQRYFSSNTP